MPAIGNAAGLPAARAEAQPPTCRVSWSGHVGNLDYVEDYGPYALSSCPVYGRYPPLARRTRMSLSAATNSAAAASSKRLRSGIRIIQDPEADSRSTG
jgi:hypothetical protein